MAEKVNVEELEELIKKYFAYIDELKEKIRNLKYEIKGDSEKLSIEQENENKWNRMLTSKCMGKGAYYYAWDLQYRIKYYMESDEFKSISKEEQKEIVEKYKKAVDLAKSLDEEYERLTDDCPERSKRIKEYKKKIKVNKGKLTKLEKEKAKYLMTIKKIDKKVEPYIGAEEINLSNENVKKREYKKENDEK